MPYEKTPLIYLTILTILFIEKVDVSAFGVKTRNLTPLVFAHGLFNSVPAGIVENQSAFNAFQTISPSYQGLTWILSYIVCAMLTLLLIKYLVKEI